jgi:nucleoside-diphosphate-sugar epimerase
VADYDVNMTGTEVVARIAEFSGSVELLVHTSTQFVARAGVDVTDPMTFDPHTAYGQSKVISEQIVRSLVKNKSWTILRPTNIWGPWHPRYPYEFWRVIDRGLYIHPGGPPVVRTYGYVGNVIQQYVAISDASVDDVGGRVLYLGDPPLRLDDWASAFVRAITGKPMRYAPPGLLLGVARFGDLLGHVKIRFPLQSERLKSMTEDYIVPTDEAISRFTAAPYDLQRGVESTVSWLRSEGLIRRR